MSVRKDASTAEHDRRVLVSRMVNHDGVVRKATRVYTVTINGELGRIELLKYTRGYASANFDPGDRRLRERLVKAFLEHVTESEDAECPNPGSETASPSLQRR